MRRLLSAVGIKTMKRAHSVSQKKHSEQAWPSRKPVVAHRRSQTYKVLHGTQKCS